MYKSCRMQQLTRSQHTTSTEDVEGPKEDARFELTEQPTREHRRSRLRGEEVRTWGTALPGTKSGRYICRGCRRGREGHYRILRRSLLSGFPHCTGRFPRSQSSSRSEFSPTTLRLLKKKKTLYILGSIQVHDWLIWLIKPG